MPMKGFICPASRAEVDFDHFDTCRDWRNILPAFKPSTARFIAEKAKSDVRHAGMELTVTRCLTCPRQTAIESALEYYVDPKKQEALTRGSMLHSVDAKYFNPDLWYTESNDSVRMAVHGELFGYKISAQIDTLKRDMTVLMDHKYPMDWSVVYRAKKNGRPKDDHEVQVNMQRELLGQQDWAVAEGFNKDEVLMVVWDGALGKSEGSSPLLARAYTEEQIANHKPGTEFDRDKERIQDAYTVKEIAEIHTAAKDLLDAARTVEAKERACARIPLVGQFHFQGRKCPEYCDVKTICDRLVRQHGYPEEITD